MIFYILIMLLIGCAIAYFGTKQDWFRDRIFNGIDPFKLVGAILVTIFWPSLTIIAPVAVAVWFGKKHRKK